MAQSEQDFCQKVEDSLGDYIDGTLSSWESIKIKRHLETCPSCRELFNDYKRVMSLAAEIAGEQTIPVDVAQRLRARLQAETGVEVGQQAMSLYIVD